MLELQAVRLGTVPYEKIETQQDRWDSVRSEVCGLMEYRINHGSPPKWYKDVCIDTMYIFGNASYLNDVCDVNRFPNGFIGEVFFMEACSKLGIECVPTYGDEDTWGADFRISDGKDTRFLDVTINTSDNGLRKKNKAGTFPTLFIPWYMNSNQSYVHHYIETGEFDTEEFIGNILSYNYKNLHNLRRDVWSDSPKGQGYMSLYGIKYLEGVEGSLNILKRGVS